MIIIGYHAVEALIRSGKGLRSVHVLQREGDRSKALRKLLDEQRELKVAWREYLGKERARFESEFKRAGGAAQELESCQGIFAEVSEIAPMAHLDLLRSARDKERFPIVVYLDSVTDPQNFGSILRSGAFFGLGGVVLTDHRSSPLTPAAIKISSGGFVHVPMARVPNLVRSLEEAKEEGFWVVGLSEHATEKFDSARFDAPIALVVGNEESGMRALTEKTCDYTLSLPRRGALGSLNAATAAAVALVLVRDRQDRIPS